MRTIFNHLLPGSASMLVSEMSRTLRASSPSNVARVLRATTSQAISSQKTSTSHQPRRQQHRFMIDIWKPYKYYKGWLLALSNKVQTQPGEYSFSSPLLLLKKLIRLPNGWSNLNDSKGRPHWISIILPGQNVLGFCVGIFSSVEKFLAPPINGVRNLNYLRNSS